MLFCCCIPKTNNQKNTTTTTLIKLQYLLYKISSFSFSLIHKFVSTYQRIFEQNNIKLKHAFFSFAHRKSLKMFSINFLDRLYGWILMKKIQYGQSLNTKITDKIYIMEKR